MTSAGRSRDALAAEALLTLSEDLAGHALATRRKPDVLWICGAGRTGGRGGCTMLRIWRVDHDMGAVVLVPADRRAGNSQFLDHNDAVPAEAMPLENFRTYWGTEEGAPAPLRVRCNHFRLVIDVASLDADLSRATATHRTITRVITESLYDATRWTIDGDEEIGAVR